LTGVTGTPPIDYLVMGLSRQGGARHFACVRRLCTSHFIPF